MGIGISFYPYHDSIAVIRPIAGGPSEKAGIKSGDRIIMADGIPIYGKDWTNEGIVNKLKGEKNTKVNLKVYRKGKADLLNFQVKRADVPIASVDAAYMLTDDLGYIKINRFAETTFSEFHEALIHLLGEGMTQLAVDLRDNPRRIFRCGRTNRR